MGLFRKKKSVKGESVLGGKLNFASSEAYKLVRANLQFVLAAKEGECSMFGVTSPDSGEGKTTTSINLAYTFAQTGQKVLLIEGDMRLPNIAKRLKINGKPGLAELLSGMCSLSEAVVHSGMLENFHVIPAGTIPPNPSELLGCARMKELLNKMSQRYNCIIVDLPPVTEVSDPMVAGSMLQGVALVVRQNYTPKRSVNETIRQLQLAGVNILGIILTMAENGSGYYKKKYKYGKYGYRRDGYRRSSSYEAQFEKAAAAAAERSEQKKIQYAAVPVPASSDSDDLIVEEELEFGPDTKK